MTDTPNGIFEWIWFIATQYADLFITGTIITLIIAVSGTILGFILGFIAGITASNHDITDIFVDSALKICGNDMEAFATFVKEVDKLSASAGYSCVMTVSAAVEDCADSLREYL